jgi:hypothetical protein
MIADIADALAELPCRDTKGISVGFHDLDIMRRREAARAAHSVMAGRVAELEAALQSVRDEIGEANYEGYFDATIAKIDAALAPHPEGTE